MSNSVGQISLDLVVNPSKFKQQMNGITKTAKSSTGALTGMFKKVGLGIAAAFSVKAIVDFSKECLKLGSDLAEVQNVVDVTFGEMSGAVDSWAKNAMTSFGMSEKVAKEYVGQLGAMSKAFGNSTQVAFNQATELAGLVGDVASFYNLTTDEAFTKLKAVYTGETEALKSLGVVMTQAALDEYALAQGYGKTTNAMSEQEKVALRLAFVTDRLSGASGDFVRTADGWANQTRVLALRFDAIKASIGQGLINALLPVVRVLNTILERLQVVADAFSNFMSTLFGNTGSTSSAISSAASGTGAISSNLGDAASSAKAIKKSLAGFDQLNILSNNSGGSGGSSGSGAGGGSAGGTTITPTIGAVAITSKAAEAVKEWFATLPKLVFDVDWATVKANIASGFQSIWESVKQWTHCILTISINIINDLGLDNLILKLSELWVAFTQLIQNITEVLTPALTTFYETAISPIVQWIGEKLAEAVRFVTELFGSWGQWFIDNQESIQAFIDMLAGFVTGLWDIIKPIGDTVWDTFKGVIQSISDIFQGFFKWVIDNKEIVVASVGAITAGLLAYKAAVGISALIDAFKKGIIATTIAENGAAVAQWALNAAMNANPIGLVIAAITALVAGFVLLWNNCEDFRNFFINMWKEIQKSVKSVINGILSGIESFVNGIINGLNFLIRAINKISFNVPDWVPGIGGKKLGFNLKEINKVSLPRLATGGYVAANTPQLAIIGDNKREGEIVAPESKITEAVVAAFRQFLPLFNNGGNNKPIYLTLKLGDGTFWEGFVDYHNDIVKRTGETPLLV